MNRAKVVLMVTMILLLPSSGFADLRFGMQGYLTGRTSSPLFFTTDINKAIDIDMALSMRTRESLSLLNITLYLSGSQDIQYGLTLGTSSYTYGDYFDDVNVQRYYIGIAAKKAIWDNIAVKCLGRLADFSSEDTGLFTDFTTFLSVYF